MRIIASVLRRKNDKNLLIPEIINKDVIKIHQHGMDGSMIYYIKIDVSKEILDVMTNVTVIADFVYAVLHDYEKGQVSINGQVIEQMSTIEDIVEKVKESLVYK